MTSSSREELQEAVAREEAQVARLEEERRQAQGRLDALRIELAPLETPARDRHLPLLPDPARPETSAEKVSLFRQLFRGRDDLYPKLWTNTTTGRKGYAPACANEWVRGICEKPRVKCGECPNQAFLPVTDQVIRDHLQGRHVVGVYPLLTDETCWLVAADFDKHSWADDVLAFAERAGRSACRRRWSAPGRVKAPTPGSSSGRRCPPPPRGRWPVICSPRPCLTAISSAWSLTTGSSRTRTRSRGVASAASSPSPSSTSRDRPGTRSSSTNGLSPTLTSGRFSPRSPGSILTPSSGSRETRAASGQGLGVRESHADADTEDEETTPWTRVPSRRGPPTRLPGPLPGTIRAVIVQKLFVEKVGLSSPQLNQIKRLAAFQNPEFYKKQRLRLSTALTPRVIACAEDLADYVALPRGCRDDLETLLRGAKSTLALDDQRQAGEPLDLRFQGKLTPVQEQATQALLAHDAGVFVAPPGVGKTVVGTYLVAVRARSTLILVHRQPLLDQWVAQLGMFLGLDPKAIGQIGAGKRRPTGRLDVAMLQSLVRDGRVDDVVAGYGHVIVDECHHVPAVSFERILSEVKARYLTGLTATPRRRDGLHPILEMQLGPVRYAVDAKSQAARRPFDHRLIVRDTAFTGALDPAQGIQALYGALAGDERRNRLILDDVVRALEEGRSPILLTERKDHLEHLATHLRSSVRHVVVLQGGMTPSARRDAMAQLATISEDQPRLVLATGRYVGEGFDDARLDTLFLTMPVSWKGTLVQYAGRLHRLHPSKTEVRIYDYVDREVPLFQRMFEKRLRGYRAIGYTPDDGPLNHDVGSGDSTGEDGTTETPAIPISRKTRRRISGRRPRKAPPRIPAPW